jgi:N-acetylglucosaminyl-diphospho-decaprenol L-rhamnosyltransferase
MSVTRASEGLIGEGPGGPLSAVAAGRVLVVIVNYKTARLAVNCLRSLEPELRGLAGSRAVIVENDSGDADALSDALEENGWGDWARLDVSDRNGGFAAGNNRAIREALASPDPPEYFLLLNADTEIYPGAVRALRDFLDARPEVGIAGSRFVTADGSVWPYAFRFYSPWSEFEIGVRVGAVTRLLDGRRAWRTMGEADEAQVDWVSGASLMIRREVFRDVGLMDEGFFLYYEETDFCLRARRAGWPSWYVPSSRVMHIFGQSTEMSDRDRAKKRVPSYWFESRRRYFLKNHGLPYALAADLAFGLGFGLWRLRRAVTRLPDDDPPRMLRDFWAHSVVFPANRAGGAGTNGTAATARAGVVGPTSVGPNPSSGNGVGPTEVGPTPTGAARGQSSDPINRGETTRSAPGGDRP